MLEVNGFEVLEWWSAVGGVLALTPECLCSTDV